MWRLKLRSDVPDWHGDYVWDEGRLQLQRSQFAERQGSEKPRRERPIETYVDFAGVQPSDDSISALSAEDRKPSVAQNGTTSITRNIGRTAWVFRNTRCAESYRRCVRDSLSSFNPEPSPMALRAPSPLAPG